MKLEEKQLIEDLKHIVTGLEVFYLMSSDLIERYELNPKKIDSIKKEFLSLLLIFYSKFESTINELSKN